MTTTHEALQEFLGGLQKSFETSLTKVTELRKTTTGLRKANGQDEPSNDKGTLVDGELHEGRQFPGNFGGYAFLQQIDGALSDLWKMLGEMNKALRPDGQLAKALTEAVSHTGDIDVLKQAIEKMADRVGTLETGGTMRKSVDGDDLLETDARSELLQKARRGESGADGFGGVMRTLLRNPNGTPVDLK